MAVPLSVQLQTGSWACTGQQAPCPCGCWDEGLGDSGHSSGLNSAKQQAQNQPHPKMKSRENISYPKPMPTNVWNAGQTQAWQLVFICNELILVFSNNCWKFGTHLQTPTINRNDNMSFKQYAYAFSRCIQWYHLHIPSKMMRQHLMPFDYSFEPDGKKWTWNSLPTVIGHSAIKRTSDWFTQGIHVCVSDQ